MDIMSYFIMTFYGTHVNYRIDEIPRVFYSIWRKEGPRMDRDVLLQDVGKRIQAARAQHDWNQSDLARAVGRARQHLSLIERGEKMLTVPLLLEIAQVLGVSTDYLLGMEDLEDARRRSKRKRRPAKVGA
jgi:ribosome-binding protein aMBF1 (putative translation factor)